MALISHFEFPLNCRLQFVLIWINLKLSSGNGLLIWPDIDVRCRFTHSHTVTPFDRFGKEAFWKHYGKRKKPKGLANTHFSQQEDVISIFKFEIHTSDCLTKWHSISDIILLSSKKTPIFWETWPWYLTLTFADDLDLGTGRCVSMRCAFIPNMSLVTKLV